MEGGDTYTARGLHILCVRHWVHQPERGDRILSRDMMLCAPYLRSRIRPLRVRPRAVHSLDRTDPGGLLPEQEHLLSYSDPFVLRCRQMRPNRLRAVLWYCPKAVNTM